MMHKKIFPAICMVAALCAAPQRAAMADQKIASDAASLGASAAERTPDAVLEVVNGQAGSKNSLLVRSGATPAAADGAAASLAVLGDGSVGIGTSTPAGLLEISGTGTNATFVPPRLDAAQVAALVNPPTGALIFNTTSGLLQYNIGTPASPTWASTVIEAPNAGVSVKKIVYSAPTGNIAKTVTNGRFVFAINGVTPALKLSSNPGTTVTVNVLVQESYTRDGFEFSGIAYTFTPANWNNFQPLSSPMSTTEINHLNLAYPGDDSFYRVQFSISEAGANDIFAIIVEQF